MAAQLKRILILLYILKDFILSKVISVSTENRIRGRKVGP